MAEKPNENSDATINYEADYSAIEENSHYEAWSDDNYPDDDFEEEEDSTNKISNFIVGLNSGNNKDSQ